MVRRSARPQPIMKYTLPVAAALALPLAAWTGAGTGEKAGLPEFKAAKWYNTPPLSVEDLEGKVAFVEVFRTW